jgi:hypothetical protein
MYLLFIMGLILVCRGNVKVENSSNSMIKQPAVIVRNMSVCINDVDVKIPSTSVVIMVKNSSAIKTRKQNTPKNRTFERIFKFTLEVIATVGKKIKKRSCVYIGRVISLNGPMPPTEKRPCK